MQSIDNRTYVLIRYSEIADTAVERDVNMPTNRDHMEKEKSEASEAKSRVVSKFFLTWMNIVGSRWQEELVYADLFAGSGYHGSGRAKGTALQVMDMIESNDAVHYRVRMLLNEAKPTSVDRLKIGIEQHSAFSLLAKSDIIHSTIDPSMYGRFVDKTEHRPTFWFLDPTGWKGLSLDGISLLTKRRYNDLVFFLSYDNINRFISDPSLEQFFGESTLSRIRSGISNIENNPQERERVIVAELRRALKELGRDSECMRFGRRLTEGTSHYLVFVTKSYTGRKVFLDIAKSESNWTQFGMAVHGFGTSKSALQRSLFAESGFEDDVDLSILRQYAGRTLPVKRIVEAFFDPYMSLHRTQVLDGLIRLESAKRVHISPEPKDRRNLGGRARLNDACVVTFLEGETSHG